jgi:hypothetical protein
MDFYAVRTLQFAMYCPGLQVWHAVHEVSSVRFPLHSVKKNPCVQFLQCTKLGARVWLQVAILMCVGMV